MYDCIHFSGDLAIQNKSVDSISAHSMLHTPLSADDISRKPKRIQPVRQTRNSQFKNNPFVHTIKCDKPKEYPEFKNYKQILDDSIESSEKNDHNRDQKLAANSDLSYFFVHQKKSTAEEEDEMFLEIRLSTLLTTDIDKDLKIISKLMPIQDFELKDKKVKLEIKTQFKNTIILDLDETLVHTLHESTNEVFYNHLEVLNLRCFFENSKKEIPFQVVKRPLLELFFELLSNKFEIIVS